MFRHLVLLSVVAAAYAAPMPGENEWEKKPEDVHHQILSPGGFAHILQPHSGAVFTSGAHHFIQGGSAGAVGLVPGAVTYSGAGEFKVEGNAVAPAAAVPGTVNVVASAPHVTHYSAGHAAFPAATGVVHHGAASYSGSAVDTIHVAAQPAVATYSGAAAVAPAAFSHNLVNVGQVAVAPAVATHHVASAPAVATFSAAAAPAVATHHVASAPAVATFSAAAAPAVATHHVAAHHVAAAPAFAVAQASPVAYQAQVEVSEPVVTVHQHAVPSAVTYQSEQVVNLGTKEVQVPVTHKEVTIPVEKRVHFGVEKYVAGSTTQIHKPKLSAPAIKAPEVFVAKTRVDPAEVTVKESVVTVQGKEPNYVHAKYDAGVEVQKIASAVENIDVPTPVEVPTPVRVAKPYAVAVPTPVKVKSEIKPVHHVDVHHVATENVVTPVEYQAHHVAQPVVAHATFAAPAIKVEAAQAAHAVVGPAAQVHAYAAPAVAAVSPVEFKVEGGHAAVGHGAVGHTVVGHAAVAPAAQVHTYTAQGAAAASPIQFSVEGGHATAVGHQSHVVTGHAAPWEFNFGQVPAAAVATGEAHQGQVVFGHATPFKVESANAGLVTTQGHGVASGGHVFTSGQHGFHTFSGQPGEAVQTLTYSGQNPVAHVIAEHQVGGSSLVNNFLNTGVVHHTFSSDGHVAAPVAKVPE